MTNALTTQIAEHEEHLKNAMVASDVEILDELLSPGLIFTNHLGQLMSKQDDLNAHQSGTLKIKEITLSDEKIQIIDSVAIVTVQAHILGSFADVSSENSFRFTRVWRKTSAETWQVLAAHSSIVA